DENRGSIIVKYLFLKFKILPADKKVKKAENDIEKRTKPTAEKKNTIGLIQLVKAVYTELKEDIFRITGHFFKRTIRIKELNISSKFGTGDPMYTGIAAGGVNAAVYNGVSFIDRHMTLDKWNVSLDADFDNACFAAGIYMKIRTRILFALKLGMMAAVLLLKIQRINRRINKNG
ncbi:MAG: DUF2953 domain-containing protein, partial [Hominilimicola sp.]